MKISKSNPKALFSIKNNYNKYTQNPISFKGLEQDTFEKSQKTPEENSKEKINSFQQRLNEIDLKITQIDEQGADKNFEHKYRLLLEQRKIKAAMAFVEKFPKLYDLFNTHGNVSASRIGLARCNDEVCVLPEIMGQQINQAIKDMFDLTCVPGYNAHEAFGPYFVNDENFQKFSKKYANCKLTSREYIRYFVAGHKRLTDEQVDFLRITLENNGKAVEVYDLSHPNCMEYLQKAANKQVATFSYLEAQIGIPQNYLKSLNWNYIDFNTNKNDKTFPEIIDLTDEKNKAQVNELKRIYQYRIEQLAQDANTSPEQLESDDFIFGELKSVDKNEKPIRYIDLDVEENYQRYIQYNYKLRIPKRSPLYGPAQKKPKEASAQYFDRLGIAPVKTLIDLVKQGKIKGTITTVDGKEECSILFDKNAYDVFFALREQNKHTVSIKNLAKILNITQKRIIKAFEENQIEVIDEYLFPNESESRSYQVDMRKAKNIQFVASIALEKELLKQQQNQERLGVEQEKIEHQDAKTRLSALRMSLRWYFCPQTKEMASELAKQDGFLSKLLKRESEEELTQKEKAKVNLYRKQVWLLAGTEEYKRASKESKKLVDLYFEKGIGAIENPEIKEIFAKYGFV